MELAATVGDKRKPGFSAISFEWMDIQILRIEYSNSLPFLGHPIKLNILTLRKRQKCVISWKKQDVVDT